MKKTLSLLLSILLLFPLILPASAAGADDRAAEALHSLGLFRGTGTDANGAPIFDLDRAPNRYEAVTMLVRLLGKEAEALAAEWNTPFIDVADWAEPYVGYAYAHKLTAGTSSNTFGGDALVTASQYLTFVLRALGYDSSTDFRWDHAWELSDRIGLTDGRYHTGSQQFLRGDIAVISDQALETAQKTTGQTLAEKLIENGIFTAAAYEKSNQKPVVLEMDSDPSKYGVPYSYLIDGAVYSVLKSFRAEPGTYTVTPLYNGTPFIDCDAPVSSYTVEPEVGSGTVTKNSDGTFTVDFPAKDNLSLALWFTYEHKQTDENGKEHVTYSRSKTSFSFTAPVPDSGFALDMNGETFLPDASLGTFTPYYVLRIYYNGVLIEDYDFSLNKSTPFTASVQADGSLLLMKNGTGRCRCTITYQGKSATFGLVAN